MIAIPIEQRLQKKVRNSEPKFSRLRVAVDALARSTLRLENAFYEYRLGLSTHGLYNWLPGNWSTDEHLYYYATSYRRIFRILDALRLGRSDTFIDLGCGKGRVTCCASLYPVGEVIGIEDVQELCAVAENNLRILEPRRAKTRIVHCRAEEFDYSTGTVMYMFHPFGQRTLAAVLSQLALGVQLNPRHVRIVYVNPVHEVVLRETKWLQLYDRWPPLRYLRTEIAQAVSFWKLADDHGRFVNQPQS